MKKVAVILPTYNEQDNIKNVIGQVLSQEKNLKNYELYVVISDSHSPDQTPQIVKEISSRDKRVFYLDVRERGIGRGLVGGIKFAIEKLKAEIIVQMDADLSHDPASLPLFISKIEQGYDLVLGSRFVSGGQNNLELFRRILSFGASLEIRILTGLLSVSEWTTSYRAFETSLFKKINLDTVPWQSTSFVTQPAFVYQAIKAGAKYVEIPIVFEDRRAGYSKMQIFRYIIDINLYFLNMRLKKFEMLIKFLVVGTVGYVVNSVVLGLLNRGEINFIDKFVIPNLLARPIFDFIPTGAGTPALFFIRLDRLFFSSVVSIELSIFSNFILHENWTFVDRDKRGNILTRFGKFNITSAVSPIIQLLTILVLHNLFGIHEQVGLAIGILIGLSWNWVWNTRYIWKEKKVSR